MPDSAGAAGAVLDPVTTDGAAGYGRVVVDPPGTPSRRGLLRSVPRWQKVLAAGGLAVVGSAAVLGMSMQSPLPIGSIEVQGASPDLAAQITAAVGASPGDSFSSVDRDAAVARISQIEGLTSAALGWAWWATLRVEVAERSPAGLIATPGGFLVVDEQGGTVRTVAKRPAGLALVESRTAEGRAAALRAAAAVTPGLRAGVDAVVADSPQSLYLRMTSGAKVLLGDGSALPEKMAIAEQLLPATKASVINVSAPQRPAVAGLPAPPEP